MENLTNYDLATLAAALRTYVNDKDWEVKHYMDASKADMLMLSMKERERAKDLLERVKMAEDRFYREEDGA